MILCVNPVALAVALPYLCTGTGKTHLFALSLDMSDNLKDTHTTFSLLFIYTAIHDRRYERVSHISAASRKCQLM